jgi:hypothetical protein
MEFCPLPPNFIRSRSSFVYRLRILYGGGRVLSIASEFYTEVVGFCLLPPNFIRRRWKIVYRLRILYGGGGRLSIASEFYTEAVECCLLPPNFIRRWWNVVYCLRILYGGGGRLSISPLCFFIFIWSSAFMPKKSRLSFGKLRRLKGFSVYAYSYFTLLVWCVYALYFNCMMRVFIYLPYSKLVAGST